MPVPAPVMMAPLPSSRGSLGQRSNREELSEGRTLGQRRRFSARPVQFPIGLSSAILPECGRASMDQSATEWSSWFRLSSYSRREPNRPGPPDRDRQSTFSSSSNTRSPSRSVGFSRAKEKREIAGEKSIHPGRGSDAYSLHNEEQIYPYHFSRSGCGNVRRLHCYHRNDDHDARNELDVRAVGHHALRSAENPRRQIK
jgi:hypothetical protein